MSYKDIALRRQIGRFECVKKQVGQRIRLFREKKRLTQANIADELEMESGNYAKIERGEIDVQVTRLEAISKILGVKVTDFFADPKEQVLHDNPKNYGFAAKTDIEKLRSEINQLTLLIKNLQGDVKTLIGKRKKI